VLIAREKCPELLPLTTEAYTCFTKFFAFMPSATVCSMWESPASQPLTSLASDTLVVSVPFLFLLHREGHQCIYGILQGIISKCNNTAQNSAAEAEVTVYSVSVLGCYR